MSARVVPMAGGRVGVAAPLSTWHAAGRFRDFAAADQDLSCPCADPVAAQRLAHTINQRAAQSLANPVRQHGANGHPLSESLTMHHWIYGDAGSGKSALARQLAAKHGTCVYDNITKSALMTLLNGTVSGQPIILDMDKVGDWLPQLVREISSGAMVVRDTRSGTTWMVDTSKWNTRLVVFAPTTPWEAPAIQAALHRRGIVRVMPISSARVAFNLGNL